MLMSKGRRRAATIALGLMIAASSPIGMAAPALADTTPSTEATALAATRPTIKLTLSDEDTTDAKVGDVITYKARISGDAKDTVLRNVVAQSTLPDGISPYGPVIVESYPGNVENLDDIEQAVTTHVVEWTGDTFTANLGNMPYDETAFVTFRARLDESAPDKLSVDVNVTSDNSSAAKATEALSVVRAKANLGVDVSTNLPAGEMVSPGTTFTYTITVDQPIASGVAHDVKIEDALPVQLSYVKDTLKFDSGSKDVKMEAEVSDAGVLRASIPTIANGDKATISFDVTVTGEGRRDAADKFGFLVTNFVSGAATELDETVDGTHSIRICYPELQLTERVATHSKNHEAAPEDLVSYMLVLTNTGKGKATDVELTDTLPDGITVKGSPVVTDAHGYRIPGATVEAADGKLTVSVPSLGYDKDGIFDILPGGDGEDLRPGFPGSFFDRFTGSAFDRENGYVGDGTAQDQNEVDPSTGGSAFDDENGYVGDGTGRDQNEVDPATGQTVSGDSPASYTRVADVDSTDDHPVDTLTTDGELPATETGVAEGADVTDARQTAPIATRTPLERRGPGFVEVIGGPEDDGIIVTFDAQLDKDLVDGTKLTDESVAQAAYVEPTTGSTASQTITVNSGAPTTGGNEDLGGGLGDGAGGNTGTVDDGLGDGGANVTTGDGTDQGANGGSSTNNPSGSGSGDGGRTTVVTDPNGSGGTTTVVPGSGSGSDTVIITDPSGSTTTEVSPKVASKLPQTGVVAAGTLGSSGAALLGLRYLLKHRRHK